MLLRDLEERDLITRSVMPTSPPSVEYALTDLGYEIQPVLKSIADVGHKLHARRDKNRRPRAAARRKAV